MSQEKPSYFLEDEKEQLRKDVHFLKDKQLPKERDQAGCVSDISGMKFGWLNQVHIC